MRRLILLAACLSIAFTSVVADASAAIVEGTVTPTAWAQEVEVCVVGSGAGERCASPAANGSYALPGVEGTVRIEFVPTYRSRLLTQYYNHKSRLSEAETVLVPSTGAKDIDADLVEGGVIAGTVRSVAGGAPLAEVEACAVSAETPRVRVCAESGLSGEYELHSLPTGSYVVRFSGSGQSAEYEPRSSSPVSVVTGVTTSLDESLAKGARIGGTVTAASGGVALGDIAVCLFAVSGSQPLHCTYTDLVGGYSFQGLSAGSYQVGFSLEADEGGAGADGFESQFYAGADTRATASTISILAPTAISGVDAALRVPSVSPPSMAPPPVAAAIVPAPPTIAAPKPKRTGCKAPKRRRNVKGKVSCVKPAGHKSRKHHKPRRKKSPRGKQGKKR